MKSPKDSNDFSLLLHVNKWIFGRIRPEGVFVDLPSLSSQQNGVCFHKRLAEMCACLIVTVRERPAAVGKTATGLFPGSP